MTATNIDARKFSDEEIIGLCVMCTLAENMKDCNMCAFKLGLAVRKVWLHSRTLDVVQAEEYWNTLPEWLWNAYFSYITPKHGHIFTLMEERCAESVSGSF